jgi:YaaC-like Protein
MTVAPIKLKQREVGPNKAVVSPLLTSRHVLTNSPWTFVGLWLRRNRKSKALFYWEQAEEFHKASVGLPLRSAPLLLYYCFMNAVKALLIAKNISFDERHGVSVHRSGSNRTFASEGIRIYPQGILPSLSQYYGEAETSRTHTLQELLFNMVFVHRTYCLTYSSQKEMFLPLADCKFVYDTQTKDVFFIADIEKNIPYRPAIRNLPPTFIPVPTIGARTIRSVQALNWRKPGKPTAANVQELVGFNRTLRRELHYINGPRTLWYLKMPVPGPGRLRRQLPTLILTAMHRLSEICRYHPLQLESFLVGQKNWLLSEFIQMSAPQFIDEVASEMTGYQFLAPNVRPAS